MYKDGSGGHTDKPKSEWRRKRSGKHRHYWERWDDEKEALSEQTLAEKVEKPKKRKPSRVEITTKDICWFLANRMTVGAEGEEEPISYTQVETFTMALFHVIADLLIDNCIVQLDDIGTLSGRTCRARHDIAVIPNLRPNKDLVERINLTGDKFISRTYNIGYEIRDEREARERVAERMHEAYLKRKEAQNDESNNEG